MSFWAESMRSRGGPVATVVRRLCWRFAALLGLTLLLLGATAGPASAHTNLVSVDPADGSVLTAGPPSVTLRFSERLSLSLVEVRLTDALGTSVPLAATTLTPERTALVVGLPTLSSDVYRLTYSVRDPVDLHLSTGAVVFAVGQHAVPVGREAEQPIPPVQAALRWMARGALAVAVGAALIYGYHRRVVDCLTARRQVGQRALRVLTWAVGALAVAETIALVTDAADIGGPFAGTLGRVLRSSTYGHRYLITLQLAFGVIAMARFAQRLPEGRPSSRPSIFELGPGLLLLGVAITAAFATHAAVGGSFALGVVLRVLHLFGFGVWAGGLVAVLLVARGQSRRWRGALLRSFSPVAFGAVTVTVVSGILMTGREVASPTALFSTQFGTVLLLKMGALGVALALAARNAWSLHRGRTPGRGALGFDAAVLVLVLGAGAVLASGQPAVGPRFGPAVAPSPTTQTVQVADLLVKLSLGPSRPGRNLLDVSVLETRRPSLGVISAVSVTLTGADGQTIQRSNRPAADGSVALEPVDLAAPGPVVADIAIDRPSAPVGVAHFGLTVDAVPTPRAPTVLSDRPLQPVTDLAAAGLLGLALCVLVWRRRRSNSQPARGPAPEGLAASLRV